MPRPARSDDFSGMLMPALLTVLTLWPVPVLAANTINLRWDDCIGDGGVADKSFACDANTGAARLVGSWIPPFDLVGVNGNQIVVDLGTSSTSLPAWWDLKNTGSCRPLSLGFGAANPGAGVNCSDWASGTAVGLLGSYTVGIKGPGSARFVASTTVAEPVAETLVATQEYFSFVLTINHLKTVGAGSCTGCDVQMCIALIGVHVTSADPRFDVHLSIGFRPTDQLSDSFVLWQPAAGQTNCFKPVPVIDRTWGEVKALYR